uniref:Calponin-homology (CH) domain-containing protein n=1 Tax=Steinernema glaseri TaxID=37863 RepID=A0A1I7Z938_9BILA
MTSPRYFRREEITMMEYWHEERSSGLGDYGSLRRQEQQKNLDLDSWRRGGYESGYNSSSASPRHNGILSSSASPSSRFETRIRSSDSPRTSEKSVTFEDDLKDAQSPQPSRDRVGSSASSLPPRGRSSSSATSPLPPIRTSGIGSQYLDSVHRAKEEADQLSRAALSPRPPSRLSRADFSVDEEKTRSHSTPPEGYIGDWEPGKIPYEKKLPYLNETPEDERRRRPKPLPEEKIRLSDGIVRLQAGTNKYDSQKGMTGFGTARRETTKMLDTKHPEYDHEKPDQSEIPLQSGTNKFASQKGMTGFGTNRRETCRIVDTNHPEYDPESSIDSTTIPCQMGSNKYASQKGMTGFGQPRWEVLDPSISWQNRKSQGMVRLQSGTNRFASQAGMTKFGTPRNNTYEAEGGELPYEEMMKSEGIIPSQAGWNKGDSQKRMTSFGAPRDVKGKHLKRIWELEYPEEAEASLDRL